MPEILELKIWALGEFGVQVDERRIGSKEWKYKKALQVFKMLIMHAGTFVTAEELLETFWPDTSPDSAKPNLYSAIYYIRDILEPERNGKSSYIESIRGKYRFVFHPHFWYDAKSFEDLIIKARNSKRHEAISLYKDALSLYRGDFMEEDPYEDWLTRRREYYRDLRMSALSSLSRLLIEEGVYDEINQLLSPVLSDDPLQEELQRLSMEASMLSGKYNEAVMVYLKFAKILDEELGLDPEPETTQLYIRALKGYEAEPQVSVSSEVSEKKGERALICNPDSFEDIYEFKIRNLERSREPFMVGTLTFFKGDRDLRLLVETLSRQFRRGDVFCIDLNEDNIGFLFSKVNENASNLLIQRLKKATSKGHDIEDFYVDYKVVDFSG
jgi:DNA-binding SARP family transcriptional activator